MFLLSFNLPLVTGLPQKTGSFFHLDWQDAVGQEHVGNVCRFHPHHGRHCWHGEQTSEQMHINIYPWAPLLPKMHLQSAMKKNYPARGRSISCWGRWQTRGIFQASCYRGRAAWFAGPAQDSYDSYQTPSLEEGWGSIVETLLCIQKLPESVPSSTSRQRWERPFVSSRSLWSYLNWVTVIFSLQFFKGKAHVEIGNKRVVAGRVCLTLSPSLGLSSWKEGDKQTKVNWREGLTSLFLLLLFCPQS